MKLIFFIYIINVFIELICLQKKQRIVYLRGYSFSSEKYY